MLRFSITSHRKLLINRIASKSFSTILFRGRQEARLRLMQAAGTWQRLERRINRWAKAHQGEKWNKTASFAVLAPDGKKALCEAAALGIIDSDSLIECGDAVIKRDFTIFDAPLPKSGPWPWHQDWRFGHEWIPTYFRSYVHDETRNHPYDVKFPWELSRLTFLQKLVQADILAGDKHRTEEMLRILKGWKDSNPLAYSVNWYPMEGAMRGIGLCLVSDMARQAGINSKEAGLLIELLAQHGEFVMRTIELTDNAGNHFTAELAALLLIGQTLREVYQPARGWYRFAEKRLKREVCRQFLSDGVNFEKSTAYHRLVQDLFMLCCVALKRSGRKMNSEQRKRLHVASRYNASFMRPDNKIPLIGDSDDAVVFGFDDYPVRDHRPSLGVAALAFKDAELKAAAGAMPAAAFWLFGKKALADWQNMPDISAPFHGHHYFDKGDMVVAKSNRHYLIMDVGEVGQNGLGGHGHNDILSFELFLNGKPFIIDPGSYLYSGDFAAHDRFRSTRAHNCIIIDGREIAPFRGKFRIADQARPVNVDVRTQGDHVIIIQAGHTGYQSLPDPVIHHRTLSFDRRTGALHCLDRLEAADTHHAVRLLHFAPGVEPALGPDNARIKVEDDVIIIRWDARSLAKLLKDEVSPCFGRLEASNTLEIKTDFLKESILTLDIYLESQGPLRMGGTAQ